MIAPYHSTSEEDAASVWSMRGRQTELLPPCQTDDDHRWKTMVTPREFPQTWDYSIEVVNIEMGLCYISFRGFSMIIQLGYHDLENPHVGIGLRV